MSINNLSKENLMQTLYDADCNKETISDFLKVNGKKSAMQRILQKHRLHLLDSLHSGPEKSGVS